MKTRKNRQQRRKRFMTVAASAVALVTAASLIVPAMAFDSKASGEVAGAVQEAALSDEAVNEAGNAQNASDEALNNSDGNAASQESGGADVQNGAGTGNDLQGSADTGAEDRNDVSDEAAGTADDAATAADGQTAVKESADASGTQGEQDAASENASGADTDQSAASDASDASDSGSRKNASSDADNAKELSGTDEASGAVVIDGADEDKAESDKESGKKDEKTITCKGDGYTVTAAYGKDAGFGRGTKLVVKEIREDGKKAEKKAFKAYYEQAEDALKEEGSSLSSARFYDISFIRKGKEIEPNDDVRISITYDDAEMVSEDLTVKAIHLPDAGADEAPEIIDVKTETADEADEKAEADNKADKVGADSAKGTKDKQTAKEKKTAKKADGAKAEGSEGGSKGDPENGKSAIETIEFTADSFSVYGIVYTVDFHYEVNGKMYDFSIPGGGFASFTDLVEVLGIAKQDGTGDFSEEVDAETSENDGNSDDEFAGEVQGVDAQDVTTEGTSAPLTLGDVKVSEDTRKFVVDVESITFSTPSLLSVSKVEESTTVGAIKDGLGLECEYSAELTEDQIAEINAQTVEAGDWALISVQPFTSEESLTVTMKNGDQFVVRVTDAVTKDTSVTVKYIGSGQIGKDASNKITDGTTFKAGSSGMKSLSTSSDYIITGNTWKSFPSTGQEFAAYIVNQDSVDYTNDRVNATVYANSLWTKNIKWGFSQNTTLTAVFKPSNSSFIYYKTDGNGNVTGAQQVGDIYYNYSTDVAGATATPADGYEFIGWFDENDNLISSESTFPVSTVTKDIALTAKFEEQTEKTIHYQVLPNARWGSVSQYSEVVISGQAQGAIATAKDGYYFVGWFDEENNIVSKEAAFIPVDQQVKDGAVYSAAFSNHPDYILVSVNHPELGYVGGSGSSRSWYQAAYSPNTSDGIVRADFNDNGSSVRYTLTAVANKNSIFDHWELNGHRLSSGAKLYSEDISDYKVSGENRLVAYFKAEEINITYKAADGGQVSLASETVFSGGTAKGSTASVKTTGYEFYAWFEEIKNDDGTYTYRIVSDLGSSTSNTGKATSATFIPSGDQLYDGAIFVAMFQPNKVIKGYNTNLAGVDIIWSGTTDVILPTKTGAIKYLYKDAVTAGSGFKMANVIPKAEGYTFIGWFDKSRPNGTDSSGNTTYTDAKLYVPTKEGQEITLTCPSSYSGSSQYCIDALWATIDSQGLIVPADGAPHTVTSTAKVSWGSLKSYKNNDKNQPDRWNADVDRWQQQEIVKPIAYKYRDLGSDVEFKEAYSASNPDGYQKILPGVYPVEVEVTFDFNGTEIKRYTTTTLTIYPAKVIVNKVWIDNNNEDGERPEDLDINLSRKGQDGDGEASNLTEKTASGNNNAVEPEWVKDDNTWTKTFENVEVRPSGKSEQDQSEDWYDYNAAETVPAGYKQTGYTRTVSADGLTTTITFTNTLSKLKIAKVWDDDLYAVNRPTSVTFDILEDGEKIGEITLKSSDQVAGNSSRWEAKADIELKEGAAYTLREHLANDEISDYHYDFETESIKVLFSNGEIILDGDTNKDGALTASNHMRGSVTVTKEVVDKDGKKLKTEDGYEILPDAEFTFKVYLKDSKGNEIKGKTTSDEDAIWYRMLDSDGTQMRDAKGDLIPDSVINSGDTIKLKAGQSLRLLNVPAGTKYKIEEVTGDIPNGYEHTGSDQYTYMDASLVSKTETADSDGYYSMRPNAWESVTVTNKYIYANVGVKKVDANDTTKLLSGAKFKLCTDAAGTTVAKDVDGLAFAEVTTVDGIATFAKVPDGTYYLIETVAPVGYTKAAPIEVIVEDSKVSYRQANNVLSVTGEGVVYDAKNNRYLLTIIEGPEEGQTVGTTDGSRQFSLDPHKQIDYLGDGGADSDSLTSAHKNDENAQQDLYRLYLDATMKKKTSNANIIFVEDWSSSMTSDDMGNGTRYDNMVDALIKTDGFVDSVLQTGSGNALSVVKFSDWRPTHNGFADGTGVVLNWTTAADTDVANNTVKEDAKTSINITYPTTPANSDGSQTREGGTDYSRWTNYTAGLDMITRQINALSEERQEYPTYVFFMSDGLPTCYGTEDRGGYIPSWVTTMQEGWCQYNQAYVWGKEKYQNLVTMEGVTGVLEATHDAIDIFKANNPDLIINAIGFAGNMNQDINADNLDHFRHDWDGDPYPKLKIANQAGYLYPSTNGNLQYNSVLRYLADGSGSYAQATNGQELAQALNNLLSIKTISQVSISDTLSDYVEMYVKSPDFAVTKKAANQDGTETKLTVTDNGDNTYAVTDGSTTVGTIVWNPTERRVVLNFVNDLAYEDGDRYELSFNVEASSKAYEEYAHSGYRSGEGDKDTDHGDNKTSVDADGFFANKVATVSYKYGDEPGKRTEYYPYPVVQVGTTQLEIQKSWYPEAPAGVDHIRFNLYAQKPGGAKTQIMNPDMPDGSFVVRATDGWKLTIDKLNPKVLRNAATADAVYEPIVYTVEEVGSYADYSTSYEYLATETPGGGSFTNITSRFVDEGDKENVHEYYIPDITDPAEGGRVKILNRSTPKGTISVQKIWQDEEGNNITNNADAHPDTITYDIYRIKHVHEWKQTDHQDATETAEGYTDYVCKHDSSHTKREVIPQLVHVHDYVVTTVAPTCTEQGYDLHVCNKDATHTYRDNYVAALGHDWDNGVVTKAADVGVPGVKTYTCKHDANHTKTEEIPALPSTIKVNYHIRSYYDANKKISKGSYGSDGTIDAYIGGTISVSFRIDQHNQKTEQYSYNSNTKTNINSTLKNDYYYYAASIPVVEGKELYLFLDEGSYEKDFKIEALPAANTNSVRKLSSAPRKAVTTVPSVTGYEALDSLIAQVGYTKDGIDHKYYTWEKWLPGVKLTAGWTQSHEIELEDEEGNAYQYFVVETSPSSGWVTSYSGQSKNGGLSDKGTAIITNQKVLDTGSLTINKTVQKNGATDTSASGKFFYAVYNQPYDPDAETHPEPVRTGFIDVSDGSGLATQSDLELGTYYVYELTGSGGTPIVSGINGTIEVINKTVYTVTGSGTSVEVTSTTGTASLTNNHQETTVTLKKVAKDDVSKDDATLLKGATFTVTKYTDSKFNVKDTTSAPYEQTKADTKNGDEYTLNGTFEFTGLSIGFYRVSEDVMPAGYVKTGDDPVFEVRQKSGTSNELEVVLWKKTADGYVEVKDGSTEMLRIPNGTNTIVIGNEPGVALPSTGGSGTWAFTIFGSILVCFAGVLLVRRRRRKI